MTGAARPASRQLRANLAAGPGRAQSLVQVFDISDFFGYPWEIFHIPRLKRYPKIRKNTCLHVYGYLKVSWGGLSVAILGLSHVQTFPVQRNADHYTNALSQNKQNAATIMRTSKQFMKCKNILCFLPPRPFAGFAGGEASGGGVAAAAVLRHPPQPPRPPPGRGTALAGDGPGAGFLKLPGSLEQLFLRKFVRTQQ